MENNKIIIGIVGEIASGKDTVAAYLKKKYHSQTGSFSEPLRAILDIIYLPHTRKNMSDLGIDLRARFGQDILAKAITGEVRQSKSRIICLPNIRLPQDIKYLKKMPGFVLISIEAKQKTRYYRLIKRLQNADDKSKSWQQFISDALLPTEIKIRKLSKQAKHHINNDGSFAKLYRQTEDILRKLKVKS